jgi:phosphoserine phosphatase
VAVRVCATRLEAFYGRWTGRVLGEPMVGDEKARAILRLAEIEGLALDQSYAYADGASDRWLLRTIGHPFAVNPSWRLSRIARASGWPILQWGEKRKPRGLDDTTSSLFRRNKETQVVRQESGL